MPEIIDRHVFNFVETEVHFAQRVKLLAPSQVFEAAAFHLQWLHVREDACQISGDVVDVQVPHVDIRNTNLGILVEVLADLICLLGEHFGDLDHQLGVCVVEDAASVAFDRIEAEFARQFNRQAAIIHKKYRAQYRHNRTHDLSLVLMFAQRERWN